MPSTTYAHLLAACLLLAALPARAQAPALLSHHGVITQGGNPVSGATQLTFRLYAQAGDSTELWYETLSVDCDAGYYSVVLGRDNPLDAADLAAAPDLHLGIAVAGGTELSPRLPVTSTPYALSAQRAAVAADVACTGCIAATEVAFSYAGSASAGGPATALECTEACIQAGELDNGAVTNAKLAPNAVNSAQIIDGTIATADLADGAVTSAKIAASTIVAANIVNTSVQQRVTGTCGAGNTIRAINADGTVVCEPDDSLPTCNWTGWRLSMNNIDCSSQCGCWSSHTCINVYCNGSVMTQLQAASCCIGCYGCSCFAAGTRVALADGRQVPIEELRAGDRVLGRGGASNTVLGLASHPADQLLYRINDRVTATGDHPFRLASGEWAVVDVAAYRGASRNLAVADRGLRVGDVLQTAAGSERVSSITERAGGGQPVYDLILDGNHTFFAEGYLVHSDYDTLN